MTGTRGIPWVAVALLVLAGPVVCEVSAQGLSDLSVPVSDGRRLLDAAKNRDHGILRDLIDHGVDVNGAEADGTTPLHWAVHRADQSGVDILLGAGVVVDATNDYGVTPLSLACTNGDARLVQGLLQAGADPSIPQSTGETPLMTCSLSGNLDAVNALLVHGADPNAAEQLQGQTALMWAASQNHEEVVMALLEAGAHIHARSSVRPQVATAERNRFGRDSEKIPLYTHFEGGFSALHFAARHGAIESAEALLSVESEKDPGLRPPRGQLRAIDPLKLRIDAHAADGTSPLVVAARSGHGAFARFLLEKGADPNADGAGYAPLHVAVFRADVPLVEALLEHGAGPDVRLTRGTPSRRLHYQWDLPWELVGLTPFFQAAKYGEPEIMALLADAGADTSVTDIDGTTPLMAAACVGRPSIAYWDRRGRNLSQEVLEIDGQDEEQTLAAVKLALELGGDVQERNAYGDTALHGAATWGFTSVVELLIEHGADLTVANEAGRSPADLLQR